ncbi:MAG TPA: DUF4126 domain-containing protein [Allosphingosinicella sp.]|uniref:DUF4126 domain-containing protein n=1 Tax=Allosphingosinicella sp. TaxID=2823234 RepID=UPI002EDA3390
MGLVEILGLAGSISLLSGWRLYLCAFATGLAMRSGWIALPDHLDALAVLANPWVLGISFVGLVAEFFADKVAWLDSAWDAVHSVVRPLGGALLTLAIVDAQDPVWQVLAFLLGGGGTLLSHGAKASARAVVNASPEPVSNVVVSTGEDVATVGLLALALANPVLALVVAGLVFLFAIVLLICARRALRALLRLRDRVAPDPSV